jgi:hypothetical protein
MLDRGDKDAITLLFAAVLNKGTMKVEQKRKEIKKAGLSGISIEESFTVRQILLFCQEKLCEKNARNSGLNASIPDASVIELC